MNTMLPVYMILFIKQVKIPNFALQISLLVL